jgi:hypothetical protein
MDHGSTAAEVECAVAVGDLSGCFVMKTGYYENKGRIQPINIYSK